MKRFSLYLLLALVGGSVSAGAVAAAAAPRNELHHFRCQRALDPLGRSISVQAVMRPFPHTEKMALRFDLLSKPKLSGPFAPVRYGDLGTWLAPVDQPNLGQRPGDLWVFNYGVPGLSAPATYRYRVSFRWTGAHNQTLALRTLLSRRCFQPELRPDLLVRSITVSPDPGKPKLNVYTAEIDNAGATAAGPFDVVFIPASASGAAAKTRSLAGLAAHASAEETFIGPACTTAGAPTVVVDPARNVDDANIANNTRVATCPAAAPGS